MSFLFYGIRRHAAAFKSGRIIAQLPYNARFYSTGRLKKEK